MSTLLEIKGLHGGYEPGVKILQGIDMTVAESEAVGIIGLNGSGKSTLGKAVMNLIPYREGNIVFNGQHVEGKSTHDLAQLGIALMHQGGVVFPNLSVWQNLQMALSNARHSTLDPQLLGIIPLLQRPKKELMRTMADKLSGGQRHELALAMTLARQPKLVILDEPSAGLSPKAVEEMYGMLRRIREEFGVSFMLIEQNISMAVCFCNRCVMLQDGVVKAVFYDDNITIIENTLFNRDQQTTRKVYDKYFWNAVYSNHYDDAPWMNDSWKGAVLGIIEQFVPENAKSLLDYGCGNGYMGIYFYYKGLKVDLSDISDILIERLKLEYSETSLGIYQTDTPDDLIGNHYDIIIAWSLFHHIDPTDWHRFLDGFGQLLNKNGIIVIGGWDEEDPVIREDGKKARFTGRETWFLNKMVNYFNYDEFVLLENKKLLLTVPPFSVKRVQHCFVLSKK